jgi:hypothetical protein
LSHLIAEHEGADYLKNMLRGLCHFEGAPLSRAQRPRNLSRVTAMKRFLASLEMTTGVRVSFRGSAARHALSLVGNIVSSFCGRRVD